MSLNKLKAGDKGNIMSHELEIVYGAGNILRLVRWRLGKIF